MSCSRPHSYSGERLCLCLPNVRPLPSVFSREPQGPEPQGTGGCGGAAVGSVLERPWKWDAGQRKVLCSTLQYLVRNEGCGGLGLHSRYCRAFGGSTNQVPGPPAGCAQAGFFLAPVGVRACVCECENLDEVSTPEGALGLVERALGLPESASWLLSLWGRLSPA